MFQRDAKSTDWRRRNNCQGKELSYNNFVDLEAARSIAARIQKPAAVHHQAQQPVRHRGAGNFARRLSESVRIRSGFRVRRRAGVQSSRSMPRRRKKSPNSSSSASSLRDSTKQQKTIFAAKKNLRLLELPPAASIPTKNSNSSASSAACSSSRPDLGELKDYRAAHRDQARARPPKKWPRCASPGKSAKHVKSNAIVFAKDSADRSASAPAR